MPYDQTDIDICNRALVQCGGKPIADFAADSVEATAAKQTYEPTLIEELSKRRWRFATKISDPLNRIAAPVESVWSTAYQMPADVLVLHAVRAGSNPIEYEIYNDRIHCNSADGSLFAEYTWRPPTATFFPAFTAALVARLMAVFAMVLNRDAKKAAEYHNYAAQQFARAATGELQAQSPLRFAPSPLIYARFP